MTVFLCILAVIVLTSPPHVLKDGEGSTVPAYACWCLLSLGITGLAFWSFTL